MQHGNYDEQCSDHLHAAAKFLETARRRFPHTEVVQAFDRCLAEYQAVLIHLLMSESVLGTHGAGRGEDDHRAGDGGNAATHAQRVIANAQAHEQYQQAMAAYSEVRRRLKIALQQLQDLMAVNAA